MSNIPEDDDPAEGFWDWEASGDALREAEEADRSVPLFAWGETCASPELALEHDKKHAKFHLAESVSGLDSYQRIRVVNFIRSKVEQSRASGETVEKVVAQVVPLVKGQIESLRKGASSEAECELLNNKYLEPVVPNDPLLGFVLSMQTGGSDDDWSDDGDVDTSVGETKVSGVSATTAAVTSSSARESALRQQLHRATEILRAYENTSAAGSNAKTDAPDNDTYYFDSYSHWGIHQEMLMDRVRTDAYRDAIEKNRGYFEGKTVLEVGCGTGILSMFAARAGAKLVVGVDMSSMAAKAKQNVLENGLQDTVMIVHGKVEDLGERGQQVKSIVSESKARDNAGTKADAEVSDLLKPGSFDIIISEWMGYALVFECMLETVLKARDVWLRKDGKGLVLPNLADVHVQAVGGKDGPDDWEETVGYWNDVYGFKMNSMKSLVLPEAHVKVLDASSVVGEKFVLHTYDIMTVQPEDLDIKAAAFRLCVPRNVERVTGICISFDCHFAHDLLMHSVTLPTGPESTPTHWKQTVLYFADPVSTSDLPSSNKDDDTVELSGELSICRNAMNPRNLDFKLEAPWLDAELRFHMG